jgi:hypothetical protein
MFALTTRPVRHSATLRLSIVARPHEAGPMLSGELIPCVSVWHDSGITPCCKTLCCAANAQLSNPRSGSSRIRNCAPWLILESILRVRSLENSFATISANSDRLPLSHCSSIEVNLFIDCQRGRAESSLISAAALVPAAGEHFLLCDLPHTRPEACGLYSKKELSRARVGEPHRSKPCHANS